MSKITFKGSPQLQTRLKALVLKFIDVFATKLHREPAAVEPMNISIDKDKWRLPCNSAPPHRHSEEKQKEIRKQVDALLKLGVIKESQASEWSQVHLVPKPTPEGAPQKWRFTLDFVRLNSTGRLKVGLSPTFNKSFIGPRNNSAFITRLIGPRIQLHYNRYVPNMTEMVKPLRELRI